MITLDRASLAQTVVVSVATFAALLLLGLVLAYWTWAWLAPRPEPRAPAVPEPGGRVVSAGGLFGSAARDGNVAAPTGIAIRLLGVAAASGGRRGYAVVQLEANRIFAVREGDDLAPGVRLAEVHPDHVVLERSGVRETLAWPDKKAFAPPPAPRAGK